MPQPDTRLRGSPPPTAIGRLATAGGLGFLVASLAVPGQFGFLASLAFHAWAAAAGIWLLLARQPRPHITHVRVQEEVRHA
jgi:hypothetical protein